METSREPRNKRKAASQGNQEMLVNRFDDFVSVAEELENRSILGEDRTIGVLIGCSGHSPIQKEFVEPVVRLIGTSLSKNDSLRKGDSA